MRYPAFPTPRPELKAAYATPGLNINTTGALTLLNGLVPGTDVSQRVGRAVLLRELELRLQFTVTAGTGVDQFVRYMIVVDRQPNGAAPVITDIIRSASVTSMSNIDNARRFSFLQDSTFHLNATAEPDSQRAFVLTRPLSIPVQFNAGTAGTVADIVTNSVYLVVVGSEVAGATAATVGGQSRIRFFDN